MFASPTRSTASVIRRLTRVAAVSTAAAVAASTLAVSSTPVAHAAPSPTAPVSTNRSAHFVGLKIGATGNNVKELQQALIDSGVYVPGGADGEFGKATEVAVSQFQRWNGLTDTGTVTQAMVKALSLGQGAAPAPAATTALQATTTNPGNPANPFVGLQIGAQGNRVKELQQALIHAGITVRGGADGAFGPATQTALKSYQERAGRSGTGAVTADDASALGLTPTNEPARNGYVGLELGAQGNLVAALQQALLDAGISVPGGADGAFGPATKNALSTYQQGQGLTASGTVDGDTARALGLGLAVGERGQANPTTSAPAPTTHPYAGLKVGASGDKVKELQRALIQAGLNLLGGADGVFGNYTKQTLQQFQRANGLEASGVLSSEGANILGLGTSNAPQGVTTSQGGYPVYGERGDRVKALQQKLLAAGIVFDGGADGHFGAATAQAVIEYQRLQGLSVTGKIDQATADKLNLGKLPAPPAPTAQSVELSVFPMQGKCYYGDTWHAPRSGGRLHEGVDLIGAEGLLLYAVTDGTITRKYIDTPGSLAGNGLRLTRPDGTYFLYFHLSDFAPGIDVGSKVKAGDVIGYNGNTGNSSTPHLHFEIHPKGGAAINPYPFVKAIDACDVTTPRS
ncbi:MAG: peptidoglycan-binding protein [Ilumatobacteraceae bacterium]|nr:peptidoglycan-binding protein [Ilumatobacteraceae bacterium]